MTSSTRSLPSPSLTRSTGCWRSTTASRKRSWTSSSTTTSSTAWGGRGDVASIDEFVNHRWKDAKESLRKLDSDFVSRLESEHRLQTLGLGMPQQYRAGDRPTQILSKKWHHLFEACSELIMQARNVQSAATSLTAKANVGMSSYEAGLLLSLVVHSRNCTDRAHGRRDQEGYQCVHS